MFTIIFDKKNRYIAWTGNPEDRPFLKNLDGMSRKYLTWIKQQIEKITTHLITKSNVYILAVENHHEKLRVKRNWITEVKTTA